MNIDVRDQIEDTMIELRRLPDKCEALGDPECVFEVIPMFGTARTPPAAEPDPKGG